MMQKPISRAETPVRVAVITLDRHLAGAADRALPDLKRDIPGLQFSLHAATEWGDHPDRLEQARADIAQADIVLTTMIFLDEQIRAIQPDLEARRDHCDAMICLMSAQEITRQTRAGRLDMAKPDSALTAMLKRLRPKKKAQGAGSNQMAMLRRLPKILKYIPGTAQDLRNYFLTMQYWLTGSDENFGSMIRLLVDRYADGPRKGLRGAFKVAPPVDYPDLGVYHPRMAGRVCEDAAALPTPAGATGTVGLLLLRSYILSKDAAHYDGVIAAMEARGLRVIPAFASGLDCRPAIDAFFKRDGVAAVDAVVSLTGFSLVGGPAYNDSAAAQAALADLDVPYLAAHPIEFQTLEQWGASTRGLMPVETTIMVAIPELDGATNPMVYGGRSDACGTACTGCDRACVFDPAMGRAMHSCIDRAERLAARTQRLVRLRRKQRSERKIAIVLFNFPPNAGATGTAAYLSVFESLHNMLHAMDRAGYAVDLPASLDDLKDRVLNGNAARHGADANVHALIPARDQVRDEKYLAQIEAAWGPAPGKQQSDGASIQILGAQFGNVLVGIQPGFGYEGDPMRLLFEQGFAPTHAFSAFYRWLDRDYGADAVLHFGTHGALEFMPGKQSGLSGTSWPDRLIGDLPNFYLYASNNPSEGAIARRRAGATLVSYLTPPVAQAGLYRGLADLKAALDRWRGLEPEATEEKLHLAEMIQALAASLDLARETPAWTPVEAEAAAASLAKEMLELEYTLIPHGLHIVGQPCSPAERADMLGAVAEAKYNLFPTRAALDALAHGATPAAALALSGLAATAAPAFAELAHTADLLSRDTELDALLAALDARFIAPAPGGDLMRTTEILPTGRNLHGFDPFRMPTPFAVADGARQAQRVIARHQAEGAPLPRQIALVLWGTDNIKQEGAPLAQALALMGARPRIDSYGRVCGAELIPLAELGRPRIDVMVTLSGIFRDLLPLQTRMLAEAAQLAAMADEPVERNFIRAHALAYQARTGADMATASLRVFSNADGAYGANVNLLIDSGAWDEADELAETYTKRKCFAYGIDGKPTPQPGLLTEVLGHVDLAYQNLDSVELGVTTVDHYFDTLGGIGRAVARAKGGTEIPVYIGDQTKGEGKVRTLKEQVSLETRTRTLNPKWFEGMLKHGAEGVRQIEAQVTNTVGWSATTGAVDPWVYQRLSETFMLDPEMRARLAAMNPKASVRMANRLIEAQERSYWNPDPETLAALRAAGEELEDRLEGIGPMAA